MGAQHEDNSENVAWPKQRISNGEILIISKIPFRPNHIKKGGEIKKMHNLLTIAHYNIGTNEDATSEQINILGKDYFDYVLGEQTGIPKKPDPAGVRRVMNRLDVCEEECLYFGDTNTDMRTGLGAGLTTVGVTWGFRGREELESFHPQYIIDHPMQVFDKIIK